MGTHQADHRLAELSVCAHDMNQMRSRREPAFMHGALMRAEIGGFCTSCINDSDGRDEWVSQRLG